MLRLQYKITKERKLKVLDWNFVSPALYTLETESSHLK